MQIKLLKNDKNNMLINENAAISCDGSVSQSDGHRTARLIL